MKNRTIYQPPVEKLLTLGNCHKITNEYNYIAELGLDKKHIPDLIRMAIDQRLSGADSASLEVWGSIHAWRALGQLRAEAAIEPLMQLFHELEDSDWVNEEMPKVYGMFGEVAIPRLQAYLANKSHGIFPRITAIHSLEEICKQHPDVRQKCIAVLTQQLKLFVQNPQELNGFIVASLIELQAVESAAVIKSAFLAQTIPDEITGTWDDVCESLGINSDKIALFTDISLDEVSRIEDISTDDVTQIEDVSQTQEIVASEESQLEDVIIDDVTQVEDISHTQEIVASEESQLEDVIIDDVTQVEDVSHTQEIVASEEAQLEDVIIDDVTQVEDVSHTQEIVASEEAQLENVIADDVTQVEDVSHTQEIVVSEEAQLEDVIADDVTQVEDVSHTQEIVVSEESQLENVIADDVTQVEDVSHTQEIVVEEKQSEKITADEVEKNLAITSDNIQLIEDVTTDVEQLHKVEHQTDEQKQPSDTNNREIEAKQLKSEVDNPIVTASVKQPSSKGFGGFATSQGKAKTHKKKKR
jgi:hypothetical protein